MFVVSKRKIIGRGSKDIIIGVERKEDNKGGTKGKEE